MFDYSSLLGYYIAHRLTELSLRSLEFGGYKIMKIEMANLNSRELHELLGKMIVPPPIALISTVGEDGIYNAAPFSLVFPVCWKPPIICASFGLHQGQKKDTVRNIEFSGDFVINIMDETLIRPTIQASANYPAGVDEIKEVGLTPIANLIQHVIQGGADQSRTAKRSKSAMLYW